MGVSIRNKALIAGAYEHPTREAPDKTATQLHAEIAEGTLADAGLQKEDVDGYCTAYGPGAQVATSLAEYIGFTDLAFVDTTEVGGASYITHVNHAASVIAHGKCDVVLITLAGKPRTGSSDRDPGTPPEEPFEDTFGSSIVGLYALAAKRHMHEYGTTAEQLAEVRVAAAHHAQYNENAFLQEAVTVDDVVESRLISDPLRLLDCCVVTDGGGGLLVVSPDVAEEIDRECVSILGHGESLKYPSGSDIDLTYTGAKQSGPRAYEEAGVGPSDIDYVSIYDSFTITVLETLEDLGFCEKGDGGEFVEGGTLQAPHGDLPYNTDGGGQCNNHPANQGGMTKVIETVRQLRREANPPVQVPNCEIALAHGTGGWLGTRMDSSTLILGREN